MHRAVNPHRSGRTLTVREIGGCPTSIVYVRISEHASIRHADIRQSRRSYPCRDAERTNGLSGSARDADQEQYSRPTSGNTSRNERITRTTPRNILLPSVAAVRGKAHTSYAARARGLRHFTHRQSFSTFTWARNRNKEGKQAHRVVPRIRGTLDGPFLWTSFPCHQPIEARDKVFAIAHLH